MDCIFCVLKEQPHILDNEHFYVIADKSPVAKGHLLVISKRHIENFFELDDAEAVSLKNITLLARDHLAQELAPDGYNLGMNCGRHAGQSVFHFHLHIIPRYGGDRKDRVKGLREFVRNII